MNGIDRRALLLLLLLVAILACASAPTRPRRVHPEPLQSTVDAYVAYAERDCEAARATLGPILETEDSPPDAGTAEIAASGRLLMAFCAEQSGHPDEAMQIYQTLMREAPMSSAASDARERLRAMRAEPSGQALATRVEEARERALRGSSNRSPIERRPAEFPPLPHAAELSGYVVVEFSITPSGETLDPVVVASDPPLLFDGAALRAVRTWRYAVDTDGSESPRQAIRLVFRSTEPVGEGERAEGDPEAAGD
jgi:TonB family protein